MDVVRYVQLVFMNAEAMVPPLSLLSLLQLWFMLAYELLQLLLLLFHGFLLLFVFFMLLLSLFVLTAASSHANVVTSACFLPRSSSPPLSSSAILSGLWQAISLILSFLAIMPPLLS